MKQAVARLQVLTGAIRYEPVAATLYLLPFPAWTAAGCDRSCSFCISYSLQSLVQRCWIDWLTSTPQCSVCLSVAMRPLANDRRRCLASRRRHEHRCMGVLFHLLMTCLGYQDLIRVRRTHCGNMLMSNMCLTFKRSDVCDARAVLMSVAVTGGLRYRKVSAHAQSRSKPGVDEGLVAMHNPAP